MWDGKGLPPAAQYRLDRAAQSSASTSMLTVASAAALKSVGLEPVGDAMGSTVLQFGWSYYGGTMPYDYSIQLASQSRYAGFRPLLSSLNGGFALALSRLLTEARALGGDGVVGARLDNAPIGDGLREFRLLGTAVRARSVRRPGKPFVTSLPGTDVAKLMLGGWVPVGLHVAREIATRRLDWRSVNQLSRFNRNNVEIEMLTELVSAARAGARRTLETQVRADGADGAVVSAMDLEVDAGSERPPLVQAAIVATTVARFGAPRATLPAPLSFLPLRTNPDQAPEGTRR